MLLEITLFMFLKNEIWNWCGLLKNFKGLLKIKRESRVTGPVPDHEGGWPKEINAWFLLFRIARAD
jgi:hypothetical protein